LSLSKQESPEVFVKLLPGRLLCVSAGTLQSVLQATGGRKKMKTERRNAATRQNVGSQEIKKKIERNRGQIKEGEITLGRETLKIILLSV
jgi:seryl-tRNA synthetase